MKKKIFQGKLLQKKIFLIDKKKKKNYFGNRDKTSNAFHSSILFRSKFNTVKFGNFPEGTKDWSSRKMEIEFSQRCNSSRRGVIFSRSSTLSDLVHGGDYFYDTWFQDIPQLLSTRIFIFDRGDSIPGIKLWNLKWEVNNWWEYKGGADFHSMLKNANEKEFW